MSALSGPDAEHSRMTPGAQHLIEQARTLTKKRYGSADPELVVQTLAMIADRFRNDVSKGYARAGLSKVEPNDGMEGGL